MRYILKIYRIFLLILFVAIMIISSICLYHFYDFIQPIRYITQSVGDVSQPGELTVTLSTSTKEPLGIVLISPSGKEYTQSSRDVKYSFENKSSDNKSSDNKSSTISIMTADLGEWSVRYRDIAKSNTSVARKFKESDAAILVETKATKDTNSKSKYVVTMYMSSKNYTYTMKAVRRSDGFSLTSSGDGGATLNLEPYAYSDVWDFYLNTKRGNAEYSTMFSYTF